MTPAARRPSQNGTRLLWWAIIAASVAASMIVLPRAKDPFRAPKEAVFRGLGLLIIAAAIANDWWRPSLARFRREWIITGAVVTWAGITTLASVNRTISVDALESVICGAAMFLATCAVGGKRTERSIAFIYAVAIVNTLIVIPQTAGIWSPFRYGSDHPVTALMGNRNDAGAYLLAPALASLVMSNVTSGARRIVYACTAIILLTGVIATQTVSAIVAYAVAALVFVIRSNRKIIVLVAGLTVVAVIGMGVVISPSATVANIRSRIASKSAALRSGDLDTLTTHRLSAFLAAWQMFADRPVTGVGPGAFHFEYFPYWLEVERRHPTLLSPYAARENFGEAHNDHLQVLAETGLIGYALFIASLVHVASRSFCPLADGENQVTRSAARQLALPLVCGFVVLAIGQFPIELAAPRMMFLLFGGLCCAWTEREAA